MNSSTTHERPKPLTETQRKALISLLGDEDPGVYQSIRGTLLEYGREALGWLRPYQLHPEPVLRRRAQEIIQVI